MRLIRGRQILLELAQGWVASVRAGAKTLGVKAKMNLRLKIRSRQTLAIFLMMTTLMASAAQGQAAIAAEQMGTPGARSLDSSLQLTKATIPPATVELLRQDLSRRTGIPTSQLRFVEVSSQTFPNGCLGLGGANEMCTQMMVSGWRVVFANGNRRWVYRTNTTGSNFRLEASTQAQQPEQPNSGSLRPGQIPLAEMPPRLQPGVVFRAIATGGITGRTYQTTLYQDGQLVQQELSLTNQPKSSQVRQVPARSVRQFMTLLRQNQLHRWHRANYLPTPGAADFITTTLSCQVCTIRYADSLQAELPANLQTVIQAWNDLTRIL